VKKSFECAVRGVRACVREERNFRIHTAAAFYVVAAGAYARLAPWQWAAVLLCIAAVLSAEIFNTAIERLADAVNPEWDRLIGKVKDLAAGGVLMLAIAAVFVGVSVFLAEGTMPRLIANVRAHPHGAVIALAAAPGFVYFVFRRYGNDKENRHGHDSRPAERGQVDAGQRPRRRKDIHRDA
jgi:diacylglycerol kinase